MPQMKDLLPYLFNVLMNDILMSILKCMPLNVADDNALLF